MPVAEATWLTGSMLEPGLRCLLGADCQESENTS